MSVLVRRLQMADDLGALVALSRAFFAEYEAHDDEFFGIDLLQDEEIVAYFSSFVETQGRAAFVAVCEGRVVGYVTVYVQAQPAYWQVKRLGHISGLMVAPEERRQGIGGRLLEQARAYFREQGVHYYTVFTAVKNREALDFYAGQGMVPLYSHLVGETGGERGRS